MSLSPNVTTYDHPLDKRLRLNNVVLTADVGNRIECATLAPLLPNSEYNPKRFAALKHRIRYKGGAPTFLIYPSGKLVCAGAPSVEVARCAFQRLFTYMKRYQHLSRTDTITVENLVADGNLGKPLSLVTLAERFRGQCMYEPELFPALTLQMKHNNMCANIFSSGKFVLTGTTSIEHHNEACAQLYKLL